MKKNDEIKTIVRDVAIIFAIFLVVSIFFKPTLVSGTSMYPTLEDRDYLILSRQYYKFNEPKRGDIVVCDTHRDGERLIIKRIIGMPGEKIKVWQNVVYINGKPIEENYINDKEIYSGCEEIKIPKGKYFVMGDNRNHSLDSRKSIIGCIKKEDLKGKIVLRVFPFNEFGSEFGE